MDNRRIAGKRVFGGVAFITLTAILVGGNYFRRLMTDAGAATADVALSGATIAWWCLAAWLAAALLRYVLHRFLFPSDGQLKRREILSDLVSGLIYLGALFGILKFAFHQPVVGLVATSGIVAVVLGLALQSTLADLFSGIALNIEGPFRAGDWITVDGASEGEVIEINWRATRLRDRSGDITIIPNSSIAKSCVTNHCLPRRPHPASISIDFDAQSSADTVTEVLIAAVLKGSHVLRDPPPEVTVQRIRGRTVSYSVTFYVVNFAEIPSAQSAALKQALSGISSSRLRLSSPRTGASVAPEAKPVTTAMPMETRTGR
ncbi:mechanosensitive ion channel [Paraburkholderia sp. A3BS-1L]|uniref:mechanosensitive ion channel family protein n=1 Tax=Paraburkholderia sp. A3BS-1L TaxID=3028375 RepID=UPI003DA80C0C